MARWDIEGVREIDADGTIRRKRLDYGEFLDVAPASNLTVKQSQGFVKQLKIELSGDSVTITDSGANGAHGSLTLFTCPLGLVQFLGGYGSLALTAGDGGIADDAAVVAAIGTTATATDNAALTTTEANIIPSTAYTLSSGTIAATEMISTDTEMPAILDGTGTAIAPKLNFAVPAADASDDDTLEVTGTIFITFAMLGPHGN